MKTSSFIDYQNGAVQQKDKENDISVGAMKLVSNIKLNLLLIFWNSLMIRIMQAGSKIYVQLSNSMSQRKPHIS